MAIAQPARFALSKSFFFGEHGTLLSVRPTPHIVLAAIFAVLFSSPLTLGQDAPDEAERLFRQGAAAFAEGRLAEARDSFQRSLAESLSVGTAFRLALAFERQGAWVDAETLLLRLQNAEFGPLTEGQVPHVESLLESVRRRIGHLQIHLEPSPADVTIRVDGDPMDGHAQRINPGEHTVLVLADGYQAADETITLADGETRILRLTLMPIDARLVVEADDPDHLIRVDGLGESHGHFETAAPPGHYSIIVTNGNGRREMAVDLEAGQTLRLHVSVRNRSRKWSWVVGAVLVGGAAAAAIGMILTRDNRTLIENDDFGGVVRTLRPGFR